MSMVYIDIFMILKTLLRLKLNNTLWFWVVWRVSVDVCVVV